MTEQQQRVTITISQEAQKKIEEAMAHVYPLPTGFTPSQELYLDNLIIYSCTQSLKPQPCTCNECDECNDRIDALEYIRDKQEDRRKQRDGYSRWLQTQEGGCHYEAEH